MPHIQIDGSYVSFFVQKKKLNRERGSPKGWPSVRRDHHSTRDYQISIHRQVPLNSMAPTIDGISPTGDENTPRQQWDVTKIKSFSNIKFKESTTHLATYSKVFTSNIRPGLLFSDVSQKVELPSRSTLTISYAYWEINNFRKFCFYNIALVKTHIYRCTYRVFYEKLNNSAIMQPIEVSNISID
jgi:hypothetical protein